jgi:hypothetical protein
MIFEIQSNIFFTDRVSAILSIALEAHYSRLCEKVDDFPNRIFLCQRIYEGFIT